MSSNIDVANTLADHADMNQDAADVRLQSEVVFSLFPGTYAVGYVEPNNPSTPHWSTAVPYVIGGICLAALIFYF